MFVQTVGMTIHDYIQCRQLTEGVKLLVFSDKPILEIALKCGYESQQSFSAVFKAMYKVPPEDVIPLQKIMAASGILLIVGAGFSVIRRT